MNFKQVKLALYKKRDASVPAKKSAAKYLLRLSTQEKIFFVKRLSVLLKSGVPMLQALQMMKKQSLSKTSAHVMENLYSQVESGQFLSVGLEKYRKIFGDFAINIVRVGEISGTLNDNLNYLAEELKKQQELRRKVVGSLVYPIFIVIATIGIVVLLMTYVFPKILPVFQSLKTKLPWSTRFLILVSNSFIHYWFYIFLGIAVLIAAVVFALKQPKIRLWFDRNILRLPLLGRLFLSYQIANSVRTLGLLLKSDVRIGEALKIVSSTMGNMAYREAFSKMTEDINRGKNLSSCMEKDEIIFPAVVTQMVNVGETTGNLSGSLLYLAEMYEDEVNNLTKNLSTSI
jgi:type II secretory pathway component PulF